MLFRSIFVLSGALFQQHPFFLGFNLRVGHGDCSEQGLRILMLRIKIELLAFREFDDFAHIHYGNAVTDMLDHRQVMRNKQIG